MYCVYVYMYKKKYIYIYSIYFFARICTTRTSLSVTERKRFIVIDESIKGLRSKEKKKKKKDIPRSDVRARIRSLKSISQ